jgi:ACR3 family arsenite efflux pump ArsB
MRRGQRHDSPRRQSFRDLVAAAIRVVGAALDTHRATRCRVRSPGRTGDVDTPITARLRRKLGPALRPLAFIGTAIVLLLIIVDAPVAFVGGLTTTVPLAAAFVVSSIATGWITGALVTKDRRDRFTLAAEFGSRNVGIAMAIAVTILGRVEFASFAVIYSHIEIPLMLAAIALFRRQQESVDVRREAQLV